jgi:putative NIF3 family GTP cyclohydrolase 1 type 2
MSVKPSEIQDIITGLFEREKLDHLPEDWGFTLGDSDVSRVGYATNLTQDTVDRAVERGVDMMITHHEAWDFVYGMKEHCMTRLREHGISHCFFHLPLDDAEFGTNASLASRLGLVRIEKSTLYEELFHCGRIGEFEPAIAFDKLKAGMEKICDEPVRAWRNNDRPVKRVCLVCGGGGDTKDVREAVDRGCDTYITGEKTLYTLEYARFAGINLIIGSHTFTELPGIEGLVQALQARCPSVDPIRLEEDHIE